MTSARPSIKVRSVEHEIKPIDPISRVPILLTGELGVMYGCRIISDAYRVPEKGDLQFNPLAGYMIFDGDRWWPMESGSDPKIQVQVPASYWSNGQRKARVKSVDHQRRLRGATRSFWTMDEAAFDITPSQLSALGISPEFLTGTKSYEPLSAQLEEFQAQIEATRKELEAEIIAGLTDALSKAVGAAVPPREFQVGNVTQFLSSYLSESIVRTNRSIIGVQV
jgi:hypothetical protein